jgi:hypothetical protein
MDPDLAPDPAIFVRDLRGANKKLFFSKVFLLITFSRYIYIIFLRLKVFKKSQSCRNQGFSYNFCLMIEGLESASAPLTNGSGSKRPKNILIRIHNTGYKYKTRCFNQCCGGSRSLLFIYGLKRNFRKKLNIFKYFMV